MWIPYNKLRTTYTKRSLSLDIYGFCITTFFFGGLCVLKKKSETELSAGVLKKGQKHIKN